MASTPGSQAYLSTSWFVTPFSQEICRILWRQTAEVKLAKLFDVPSVAGPSFTTIHQCRQDNGSVDSDFCCRCNSPFSPYMYTHVHTHTHTKMCATFYFWKMFWPVYLFLSGRQNTKFERYQLDWQRQLMKQLLFRRFLWSFKHLYWLYSFIVANEQFLWVRATL